MKYSKSDSEYFRNKKGGGLETNGKLNAANFSRSEIVELKEMNSSNNNTTKIKPIKIMVKKKSGVKSFFGKFFDDEHYIFFGLNQETGIYEYVIYLNPDFSPSGSSPIICKKRNDDGTIVELNHEKFLDINIRELSILIYNLLLKHQQNDKLLHENFFIYLLQFVLPSILKKSNSVNNKNLKDIIGKIKEKKKEIFGNHILPNNNNNNEPALPPRR